MVVFMDGAAFIFMCLGGEGNVADVLVMTPLWLTDSTPRPPCVGYKDSPTST